MTNDQLYKKHIRPILRLGLSILLCGLITDHASAQKPFFGLGTSFDTHYFQHKDKSQFDSTAFQPALSHSLGINAFVQFSANQRFQFRANVHLGKKKVGLVAKEGRFLSGQSEKVKLRHELVSADVSLLSSYDLTGKANQGWSAMLGFFCSFNQYLGFVQTTSSRNSSSQSSLNFDLKTSGEPFSFYAGLNAGMAWRPKPEVFRRYVELYALLYLSPSQLFSEPVSYSVDNWEATIEGRHHYVSVGMSFELRMEN